MPIKIVTGPPAAGKSTHVDEHRADGDVAVDFDRIAEALGNRFRHNAVNPHKGLAHEVRELLIKSLVESPPEDFTAWVIHTSPTAHQMAAYETAGAEFITVDPGMDAVLEQAAGDDRPDWTENAIRQWYNQNSPADEPRKGRNMPVKTLRHERGIKSGDEAGLSKGQFVAYAAIFDVKDSHGDIIRRGAFADTLEEWAKGDAPIPVLWGHDFSDMHNNIGHVIEASEDERGLLVTAQLDLGHPNGVQAHKLIQQKRVTDLSFAFDVQEHKVVNGKDGDEGHTELLKLGLFEVSVVPIGANRETEFLAVKKDARKVASAAGRIEAATTSAEQRSAAISLMGHVKEFLEGQGALSPDHETTAHAGQVDADPEEPDAAKGQSGPSVSASAEYMERKLKFYALRAER